MLPRLATLAQRFPEVTVELVVNDGLVDIVAARFDCGVRQEGGLQGDMISVRISEPMELVFAAAPAYLEAHDMPATPDDLGAHRCISYRHTSSGALHRWEFVRDGEIFGRAVPETFVTNDSDVMHDAALSGLGVVCLLRLQAARYPIDGSLTEVLPGWAPVLAANHLYYLSCRQPSAAFRAFLEVMRA